MDDYTADDVQEALRPLASLISKSEKAQQKVAAETWQYAMLRDNLAALRHATALLTTARDDAGALSREDLQADLAAVASMIDKTENAQAKFAPGTSQHSLARNRLKALRVAEAALTAELD